MEIRTKALIGLVFFAALFVFSATMLTIGDTYTEETTCYDEHNNKIVDLICLEEIRNPTDMDAAYSFIVAIGLVGVIIYFVMDSF